MVSLRVSAAAVLAVARELGDQLEQDLDKGHVPAEEIDGWMTLPSSATVPGALHRARVPVAHVRGSAGKLEWRVHPKFEPSYQGSDAEIARKREAMTDLKARTFVTEGKDLEDAIEIAGEIAKNTVDPEKKAHLNRQLKALISRTHDEVEEPRSASRRGVSVERQPVERQPADEEPPSTNRQTAKRRVSPTQEEPQAEERRYNAYSLIQGLDAARDETGGHANRQDARGWSSADKGLGGRLASLPQEDWTSSDWQAAKYLLIKYSGQTGAKIHQIEGMDKVKGDGARDARALSLVRGDLVVDTPYDEYHHRVVDEALGTRYAGNTHGKGKRAVSVDRFVSRFRKDIDPAEALRRFAEEHGYEVDPELVDRVEAAKQARLQPPVQPGQSVQQPGQAEQAKSTPSTPWDDSRVGFGRDPNLSWKDVAKTNPGFLDWMIDRFPKGDPRRDKAEDVRDAHIRGTQPSSASFQKQAQVQQAPEPGQVQQPQQLARPMKKELETPWDNVKIGGSSKNAEYTWGELWQEKPRSVEFYATDREMAMYAPGMVEIAQAILAAKRDGVENDTIRVWRERKEKLERDEAERAAARNVMEAAKRDTTVRMPPEFKGGLFDPEMGHVDPTTYERDPETGAIIPGTAKPAGVRPYQAQAVNYMVAAKRCSDFDEMGAGKSVSAIMAGLNLKHAGEVDGSAIMIPPSLMKNWRDELSKFAPQARVLAWTGNAAQRREVYERAKREGFDFLVIPSSMIIQKEDGPLIGEVCGGERIAKFIDEAHELKGGSANVKAKMTMDEALFCQTAPDTIMYRGEAAVPGLTADIKKKMYKEDRIRRQWVLTDTWRKHKAALEEGGQDALEELTSGVVKGKRFGAVKQYFNKGHFKLLTATPVPNDPKEIYRLMQLIDPAVLGDRKKYEDRYLIKKNVGGHERVVGAKNLAELHERLKPYFIMRQLKDPEVGIHLPPLVTSKPTLDIAPEQVKYYRAAVHDVIDALEGASDSDTATAIEGLAGEDESIDPDAEAARVDTSDKKRKNILTSLLRLRQVGLSPELVDRNYEGPSPKIQEAAQMIRDHLKTNPGQGIAVFCEFNNAFPILQRELMREDEDGNAGLEDHHFGMITGETPQKKRDKIQDEFNAGRLPVALINIKAGGVGLNLQKNSSAVVHLSSHWNPKMEDQATARVYRPGQLHKTLMYKPLMDDPMDKHIEELHERKRKTADAILKGARKRIQGESDIAEARKLIPRLKEFLDNLPAK